MILVREFMIIVIIIIENNNLYFLSIYISNFFNVFKEFLFIFVCLCEL